MSMEMTVQPLQVAAVTFNKTEMAAAIAAINDRYKGLVVTDKAEAKRDRAEVNRLLKQIDDARKTVKKQYEAPLKAFEADIKELTEPLKASAAAIDAQIKAIEEQERNERMAALEAIYAEMKPCVPFSRVFDARWCNSSTSAKKATEALTAAINAAENDLAAIKATNSTNMAALVDEYNNGATLAEVLAYNDRLMQTAQTFAIAAEPTADEVAAQLAAEDPRNEYTVTDTGVQVTAKTAMHTITVNCSDSHLAEICRLMDAYDLFYVIV